jgi:hypothetical protein
MSDDFATLVNKLNQMSEENYQNAENNNKEVVTESADDMRGILDKFNSVSEENDNLIASKGNIEMRMTESHTDTYDLDVLIDNKIVAQGQYDRNDKAFTIDNDDFGTTDEVLEAFAQTAEDEGHTFKEEEVKEGTPDENYVENMFQKAQAMINSLEKVFRPDGLMHKKIDAIGGDTGCCSSIQESLSNAYEALEDGHYRSMAHIVTDSKLKAELEAALNEEPAEAEAVVEKKNCGCGQDPCVTYGDEVEEGMTSLSSSMEKDLIDMYKGDGEPGLASLMGYSEDEFAKAYVKAGEDIYKMIKDFVAKNESNEDGEIRNES